jgi:hypothetical protein
MKGKNEATAAANNNNKPPDKAKHCGIEAPAQLRGSDL